MANLSGHMEELDLRCFDPSFWLCIFSVSSAKTGTGRKHRLFDNPMPRMERGGHPSRLSLIFFKLEGLCIYYVTWEVWWKLGSLEVPTLILRYFAILLLLPLDGLTASLWGTYSDYRELGHEIYDSCGQMKFGDDPLDYWCISLAMDRTTPNTKKQF